MWALFSSRRRDGFTLVELLIVIVVIAILAAITIVAYGNITSRAQIAALQSDLGQAKTFMEGYLAQNGQYPADLPTAEAAGLKFSVPDSQVSYSVNNNANPQTWGITESNNSQSYYVNNTGAASPTSGAWVTNLLPNPSIESGTTANWSFRWYGNTGGAGTNSVATNGGYKGNDYLHKVWTTASSAQDNGFNSTNSAGTVSYVSPGTTYTASAYVRTNRSDVIFKTQIVWQDATGTTLSSATGPGVTPAANTWTRTSETAVAPAGAVESYVIFSNLSNSYSWAVGDTLDMDAAMFVQSGILSTYTDPLTSPAWSWNGTANNSTSTGPTS